MLKKYISVLMCTLLLLCGCTPTQDDTHGPTLKIVSVSFPGYSFSKEIGGSMADVALLLPVGSEAHDYEPTPKDILKIQNCDIFIYGGGESEEWVREILASLDHPIRTVAMNECVQILHAEHDEDEQHEHHQDVADSHTHDDADEHVWTNPQNAIAITEHIAAAMCAEDSDNATYYTENKNRYIQKLTELDLAFETAIDGASTKEIVIGDRFPFLYLAERYGLTYHAAFPGCSGESEPSAQVIARLIELVNNHKIPVVFYTEFSNQKVANTICEATSAKPMLLHSCHNVSKADFEAGVTYLQLMEQNLSALKEALYICN